MLGMWILWFKSRFSKRRNRDDHEVARAVLVGSERAMVSRTCLLTKPDSDKSCMRLRLFESVSRKNNDRESKLKLGSKLKKFVSRGSDRKNWLGSVSDCWKRARRTTLGTLGILLACR
jgi:hypothetical protein